MTMYASVHIVAVTLVSGKPGDDVRMSRVFVQLLLLYLSSSCSVESYIHPYDMTWSYLEELAVLEHQSVTAVAVCISFR